MRIQVDSRFDQEIAEYDLRFTCADCVHHMHEQGACAHEWPNQEHMVPPSGERPAIVVFCKEFELT